LFTIFNNICLIYKFNISIYISCYYTGNIPLNFININIIHSKKYKKFLYVFQKIPILNLNTCMQTSCDHIVYDVIHACVKSSIVGFIPRILQHWVHADCPRDVPTTCRRANPCYALRRRGLSRLARDPLRPIRTVNRAIIDTSRHMHFLREIALKIANMFRQRRESWTVTYQINFRC